MFGKILNTSQLLLPNLMGDYGVSVSSNIRSLSPVDLQSLNNHQNQSLFQNCGDFINPTMQHHHPVESIGIVNGSINGVHTATDNKPGIHDKFVIKNSKILSVEDKNTNSSDVNSVAVSLTQLGLTENNTNINLSIPNTLPSPSLWSGSRNAPTADETCVNGIPGMNGGAITFQNFSSAPGTLVTPSLGMGPGDTHHRRPITGQSGNGIRPQQQIFMNSSNKSYPAWSPAQQQTHGVWNPNMSPWNTQHQALSQNVNPIGAPKKAPNSYIMSPSKFRQNQFPGQMPMEGNQGLLNEKDVRIITVVCWIMYYIF